MPSDPSIYSQLDTGAPARLSALVQQNLDPVANQERTLRLGALQNQGKLQNMQMQTMQRNVQKDAQMDAYMKSPQAQAHLQNPDKAAGLRDLQNEMLQMGIADPLEYMKERAAEQTAAKKPMIIPAGATLRQSGQPDFTAPDNKPPPLHGVMQWNPVTKNYEVNASAQAAELAARTAGRAPAQPPASQIFTDNNGNTFTVGRDNIPVPLKDPSTGVQLKGKVPGQPVTEYQGKSLGFGARAMAAHDILNTVGNDGVIQPGLIKRSAEAIPIIGGGLGTITNFTQSAPQQQIEQAQRDFVNAVLRQESGAAINTNEFDNARKQYFPQPGDSKKVIAQKKSNREIVISTFHKQAGPLGDSMSEISGTSAAPKVTTQAEVQATAEKYGVPISKVIADAKAKGYTVQ